MTSISTAFFDASAATESQASRVTFNGFTESATTVRPMRRFSSASQGVPELPVADVHTFACILNFEEISTIEFSKSGKIKFPNHIYVVETRAIARVSSAAMVSPPCPSTSTTTSSLAGQIL
jgi:hypothetical protein